MEGGKILACEFREGQIFSARDFQICTAPPPALNNDRPLTEPHILKFHFRLYQNQMMYNMKLPSYKALHATPDYQSTSMQYKSPFKGNIKI